MKKVSVLTWLKGKKTYIGIAAGVVYSVAIQLGYVASEEAIWTVIVAWTGIAFRLAQKGPDQQ